MADIVERLNKLAAREITFDGTDPWEMDGYTTLERIKEEPK